MSTVYQACKCVGRQPSSFSGFWITRGGSTRCPQNPAYPVAIAQPACSPAGKTWLLGSVSKSLPGLVKTEPFRISAPTLCLGPSARERTCPCPGSAGWHRALGGVLAKLFPPGSRHPGAGIQSRHTQPCTPLHPSCPSSVGVSPSGCRLRAG